MNTIKKILLALQIINIIRFNNRFFHLFLVSMYNIEKGIKAFDVYINEDDFLA